MLLAGWLAGCSAHVVLRDVGAAPKRQLGGVAVHADVAGLLGSARQAPRQRVCTAQEQESGRQGLAGRQVGHAVPQGLRWQAGRRAGGQGFSPRSVVLPHPEGPMIACRQGGRRMWGAWRGAASWAASTAAVPPHQHVVWLDVAVHALEDLALVALQGRHAVPTCVRLDAVVSGPTPAAAASLAPAGAPTLASTTVTVSACQLSVAVPSWRARHAEMSLRCASTLSQAASSCWVPAGGAGAGAAAPSMLMDGGLRSGGGVEVWGT